MCVCAGVCVLGEKLFAVGGYDGSGYLSLVESYDNREKTWRQVASLNTHRAGRQTYKVNHDAVAAIRSFYFQQLPCQLQVPMQRRRAGTHPEGEEARRGAQVPERDREDVRHHGQDQSLGHLASRS